MQNNFLSLGILGTVGKCHVSSTFPKHSIDGRQYSANVHNQFRILDIF